MAVAILSGLWLTDLHGGFDSAARSTDFDRTLIVKSVLVVSPRRSADPRLRARPAAGSGSFARAICRRLRRPADGSSGVGWFTFTLTVAVPVLGAVVLTYLD